MISKYNVYLSAHLLDNCLSVLVKLLIKQWEHSFRKVCDNEMNSGQDQAGSGSGS